MKLIVECGATKTEWTLVHGSTAHGRPVSGSAAGQQWDDDGPAKQGSTLSGSAAGQQWNDDGPAEGAMGRRQVLRTGGMNFSSGEASFLAATLQAGCDWAERTDEAEDAIREVHFYAAGLFPSEAEESPFQRILRLFRDRFPAAEIQLENDLLAAARAVCGHRPGIAAILGTGSNACLYDGARIVRTVPSGGFILGDEGSAGALGRMFIADYIKGLVPERIAAFFREKYALTYPGIVQEVFHGASPAGYLGAFAPDILSFYADEPYIRTLVDGNFRAFINRCIRPLSTNPSVGVVGGFGYACREMLATLGEAEGVRFCRFLASPSEALIAYHQ